jgi:PAS domain S-box-containing protein
VDIVDSTDVDEVRRLSALSRYGIGSPQGQDHTLTRFAELAARATSTPAGFVNIVGKEHVWSHASFGNAPVEMDRLGSPCGRAILTPAGGYSIPDTLIDPDASRFPLLAGAPNYRSYAGVTLRSGDGLPLGTVCVLDRVPRTFDPELFQALQLISQLVMEELEERRVQTELLDKLPEPALVCDVDWQILSANAAVVPHLGATAPGVGSALRDYLPYEAYRAIAGSVRPGAAPGPVEITLHGRRFEVCAHPTPAGRQLHFLDVTAVRAELANLHRSHQLFEALIDGSRDAIFAKDLEGRYTLINRVGARYFGRTREDILGRTDVQLSPGAIAEGRMARDRTALGLGRTVVFEESEQSERGVVTWSSSKGVLREPDGKVFGIFGISRDLTERKRREEALQLSEERLRLAMAAGELGAWDWDVATGKLQASGSTMQLLGLQGESEGTLAEAVAGRLAPVEREALGKALTEAVERSLPLHREFPLRALDGSIRWLRADGQPIADDLGRTSRLVGVISDVTGARKREQEVRSLAHFQEQLLGIVSHDLRNPLSAIRAWTGVLVAGDFSERNVRRVGERVLRSALRMEQMITELLDFTRARLGGGIPVHLGPGDIHEITNVVVEELRAAHPDRIDHRSEGEGSGTWDAMRLGQVASNLIGNALQHSPPGSHVEVVSQGLDGWVQLLVKNRGPPIPAELRDSLFEPFRSGADGSRHGHLGLGLYIARETVLAHGGDIEVTSDAGSGTSFCVRLPRTPR